MAFIDPRMSKQGAAGKRKHVTLMIPQKGTLMRLNQQLEISKWNTPLISCAA
jgi:hypothetical protein